MLSLRDVGSSHLFRLELTPVLLYPLKVRIFKNTWFTRFAGNEGITDGELREMVSQLEAGQADADLGGGVYKIRLAGPVKESRAVIG